MTAARRNLSPYARSELALELEGLFAKRAQLNCERGGGSGPSGRQRSDNPVDTKREVAKVARVSHDTIAKAKVIKAKADEKTKQAGESLKIQNHCAEIKLRAERKAGGLLKEMPKQAGARGKGKKVEFHDGTPLADLGIDKKESHRWQREASVPDSKFETWIAEQNEAGEERA